MAGGCPPEVTRGGVGLPLGTGGKAAPAPKKSVSLVISRDRRWGTLDGRMGEPVILVREWRLFWGFVCGTISPAGDPSFEVLTGWAGVTGGPCSGISGIL